MHLASSQRDGAPLYSSSGEQQANRNRTGRILAIEPDEEIRAAIDGLLAIHGCDVRTVLDYRAGLDLMAMWEPNIIFLDVDTLESDAARVVAMLQEGRQPPPPVVLLTRRVFGSAEALRLGAVARVQTPFDVEDVLRLVARYAPCG